MPAAPSSPIPAALTHLTHTDPRELPDPDALHLLAAPGRSPQSPLERRRTGGWSEPDIHETLTTMRAVYERLPGDGYYVQVPGMFHADMTDVPALSPLVSGLGFSGPIGVRRAHQIVNAYSLALFDRHLKGRPAALLDGPAAQYPEVQLETRRP